MRIQLLSLFIILIFAPFQTFGQIQIETNSDAQMYLKLTNIVAQYANSYETIASDLDLPDPPPRWHKEFKKLTDQFLTEQVGSLDPDPGKLRRFWALLNKDIKWKNISTAVFKIAKGLKGKTRTHGLGFLIVVVTAQVSRNFVPIYLAASGHKMLAIAWFWGCGNVSLFSINALASATTDQFKKIFAMGAGKYMDYLRTTKIAKKMIEQYAVKDVFIAFNEKELWNKTTYLKVKNPSKLQSLLYMTKFDSETLTHRRLIKFIKDRDAWSYTMDVIQDSKLPKEMKSVLIMQALYDRKETSIFTEMQLSFGESFVTKAKKSRVGILYEWTNKILNAKSIDDFYFLLSQAPEYYNSKTLLMTWKEIILPNLAKRPDLFSYYRYRKMVNGLHQLDVAKFLMPDQEFKTYLNRYFQKIGRGNICLNSHDQVLRLANPAF